MTGTNVVVVGAGVAGLATAIALQQIGQPCTLLERAPTVKADGYGLLLMANGVAALDRLGVGNQARHAGVLVSGRHDALADGTDLGPRPLSPHLVMPRDRLMQTLLQALPPGSVRTGARVMGVTPNEDGATVVIDGQPALQAGIVVGADGSGSRLRQTVAPRATPGAHRLGEFLARVQSPIVHRQLDNLLRKWLDPAGGLAVGMAPLPDGDVLLYLQVSADRWDDAAGAGASSEQIVKNLVGAWPSPIPEALAAVDYHGAQYAVSTDIEPLPSFVRGPVVLAGDAAHPMLTLSTQGASTALEDALALADAIQAQLVDAPEAGGSRPNAPLGRLGPDRVAAALAQYDAHRQPVAHKRTEDGRRRFTALMAPAPRFDDGAINRPLLRRRAYNHRWAMQAPDVIPLTAADPDFDAPPVVRDAIIDHVSAGAFSYGPPDGLPGFREAVADVMTARRGVPIGPDGVIAADSAASGMYVMAKWLLGPGDEAIVFDPVDYLFVGSVEAAGATVVRCPLDPATGRFDPDELRGLVTPRTKMLGLCNPHNPLGRVIDQAELETLAEIVLANDLYVMNDEVWADIIFAPHVHRNLAALGPDIAARTVTVGGFSKSFGLAGLRIGYLATTDKAVRDALFAASQAESTAWGAATLSQVAAEAAYRHGWPWFSGFLHHLTRMRDLGVRRLNAIDGITCNSPEGTYLLFPDISALGIEAEAMAEHLMRDGRLAIVPGSPRWFGTRAVGHVRLAFATSETILTEGLDRFEAAVSTLPTNP